MAQRLGARAEVPVVRAGESVRSAATRAAWVVRKARHGARGTGKPYSAERRAKIAQANTKTHCWRGHPLSGANLYHSPGAGKRQCLACIRLRARGTATTRPEWAIVGKVRVSVVAHDAWCVQEGRRLFADVSAAHPDRPRGSATRFRAAMKRWRRFVAEQEAWYRQAALPLPEGIKKG